MLNLMHNKEVVQSVREGGRFEYGGNVVMGAQAGWEQDGYSLVEAPPPPEPEPLTPEEIRAAMPPLTARQLRLGLVGGGILPSQVDAAIAAIPDEQARAVAQIEWEYASQFERDHPLIEQVGTALGLTAEQIDTMWQAAMAL